MNSVKPMVGIVMGSDSDMSVMEETSRILKEFDVPHEILVTSAHRSPERTRRYVKKAERDGMRIIIAGAGASAHLAGVIAAETTLPVIGVPIDSSALKGLDALLSTVQMPGGVPVATMAIGKPGARNAAVLAVQILALNDSVLASKLLRFKKDQVWEVERKSKKVQATYGGHHKA
ncbi:MAG: 5-(carboxyamino)imidazole ribonucleotide mutase [Nitrospinae bacterium CG11_big_fil_rev_8_21_14_0_20_56_8]|nr:MAG: 5-(carboxyamino)imidazole ribonucleotide mutase [Nitrospinae bacterium CG11_big_fil_rev_8_21_14_0_20_56_8]